MPNLDAVQAYIKQISDAIGSKDPAMVGITAVLERKRQYRIPNGDMTPTHSCEYPPGRLESR